MYHDDVHLHPTTVPSYTLWFLRYGPDKILKVNVTTAKSKVKSRSHHDFVDGWHLYFFIFSPTLLYHSSI